MDFLYLIFVENCNTTLSILSFLLAAISIVFVCLTLHQNNKMLEAANRPYISISFDSVTGKIRTNFFILKNYGNSPAVITRFDYTKELELVSQPSTLLNEQFSCISGLVLAPGQCKLLPYKVSNLTHDVVEFHIEYYASGLSKKIYDDSFVFDVKKLDHIPSSKPYGNNRPMGSDMIIANLLHDLVEKQL